MAFFSAREASNSKTTDAHFRSTYLHNREVKHDVYGKRQTTKMELLPSVSSSLYSGIKVFVFAVNSTRYFFYFLYDLYKDYKKRIEKQS